MSKNITPIAGNVCDLSALISGRAKSLADCATKPDSLPLGQYVSYGDMANSRTLKVVVEATGGAYGQRCIDTVTFHTSHVSMQAIEGLGGWRLEDGIADQEQIDYLIREEPLRMAEEKREREVAKNEKVAQVEQLTAELKEQYPWAKPAGARGRISANVKKDLSLAFPGVKFSVRSDYSSVDVSWTDGPTGEQVDKVLSKYKSGSFDGMVDSYDYDRSAYGDAVEAVLGRVKYAFTHREFSARFLRDRAIEVCFEYNHETLPKLVVDGAHAYFERDNTPICKGAMESVTEAIMKAAYATAA